MIFCVFPPQKSLKNLIVNILLSSSNDAGLTVQEIRKVLKDAFGFKATYQGVYKILNSLVEEHIILKKEGYLLNTLWVEGILQTMKRYTEGTHSFYIPGTTSVEFTKISSALDYMFEGLASGRIRAGGPKVFVSHYQNLGFYRLSQTQRELLQRFFSENECHLLIENNNYINRLAARFFSDQGAKIYFGIPRSTPFTISVFGHTVYRTYIPTLSHFLTHLYKKVTKISDSRIMNVYDTLMDKNEFTIRIIFENDQDAAKEMRTFLLDLTKRKSYGDSILHARESPFLRRGALF